MTGSPQSPLNPPRRFIICDIAIEQSFGENKQSVRLCLEQNFEVPIGGKTILAMPVSEHEETVSTLLEALKNTWKVIDAAGLDKLMNGVELGPLSWAMKAIDARELSLAAIAKAGG